MTKETPPQNNPVSAPEKPATPQAEQAPAQEQPAPTQKKPTPPQGKPIPPQGKAAQQTKKNPPPNKRVLLSVPTAIHICGTIVEATRPLWIQAGKLESLWKQEETEKRPIERPLFICGLTRSGSSALLETLNKTEAFATHHNKDYPFVDIPILWNEVLAVPPEKDHIPVERAGDDGLNITPESPEALEEMLWTPFFKKLHNPGHDNKLGADTNNEAFEKYYKGNIQKMLLHQRKNRYISKNNYILTRIKYLVKLFPDARFVILVRHPGPQIASMIKQHKLFLQWEKRNPRMAKYVRRIRQYEFGAGRRTPNLGDKQISNEIRNHWKKKNDVAGYALLWNHVYQYVHYEILQDESLKNNVTLLRFEDLCNNPEIELRRVLKTVSLEQNDQRLSVLAEGIKAPNYYKSGFTDEEREQIKSITEDTSRLFFPQT